MEYDTNYWMENKSKLLLQYEKHLKKNEKTLTMLTKKFESILAGNDCNAQIKGRIKSFEAFYRKLLYRSQGGIIDKPFDAITDIIAARLVVPFLEDLDSVEKLIKNNFQVIETEYKSRELSIREFGYDSIHLLINIP
ncbi:MAG: RelA/SpoT domain-containing protein, partial [Leptospirales bacterium]|nr:RelA/SpoT domain-containing protein [Leptospirales bacterium]